MNILKSRPFPELQTSRLRLRSPSASDVQTYHDLLSFPEISKFSDVPSQPSKKQSTRFVNWMRKLHAQKKGVAWIIETTQPPSFIGAIRINSIEKKISCGTIAYELHPEHWQQGYAIEAVQAVVLHAHKAMKLNRLEAHVIGDNKASDAVLLKNGFALEGQLRQKIWFQNQYWDTRLYARLAQDEITSFKN